MKTLQLFSSSVNKCRGVFIVFAPFAIIAILGFSALAVDMGMMRVANAELRGMTESAARAAVNALPNGNDAAISAAYSVASQFHMTGGSEPSNIDVQLGQWDKDSKTFTATDNSPNAAKVTAEVSPQTYFAKLFTNETRVFSSSATATQPASTGSDILFVVALDNSTNEESLTSQDIGGLTEAWAKTNRQEIYAQAGLQPYGNLTWEGVFIPGTQTVAQIKTTLGLDDLSFPTPSGNWDAYINYVKTQVPPQYRHIYGYDTLAWVLLRYYSAPNQIMSFNFANIYPLQATKESVRKFTSTLGANDRVGLITGQFHLSFPAINYDVPFTSDLTAPTQILEGNSIVGFMGKQPNHYGFNASRAEPILLITSAFAYMLINGREDSPKLIYVIAANAQSVGSSALAMSLIAALAKDNKITITWIESAMGRTYLETTSSFNTKKNLAESTGGKLLYYPTILPTISYEDQLQEIRNNAITAFGGSTSASTGGSAQIVE